MLKVISARVSDVAHGPLVSLYHRQQCRINLTLFFSEILFKIVLGVTLLYGMFYNLRSIALASAVNIVTSSGSRTENMSLLTTAAAAT